MPIAAKTDLWLWAIILFGTRAGAATIEVMSESYFFKKISEENADAIAFFRNNYPLAYVIAPLLATPILLFVPYFKYIFYILGAIVLCGLFIALRLKDIK
jgi:MFS family permease